MTTPAPTGLDADLWIQERIRHGQHVIARSVTGVQLLHPGCEPPCEYSGRDIKLPTDEKPIYVAEISKDGTITPEAHAQWEDVTAAEDPAEFERRNA
ncbi:MAG: hypothetical protein ABIP33_06280 [Pseudolysinimonas sp.]